VARQLDGIMHFVVDKINTGEVPSVDMEMLLSQQSSILSREAQTANSLVSEGLVHVVSRIPEINSSDNGGYRLSPTTENNGKRFSPFNTSENVRRSPYNTSENNIKRLSSENNLKRLSPSSTTEHNVKRLSPSNTTEHNVKRLSPSNTTEHNVKRLSPYSTSENIKRLSPSSTTEHNARRISPSSTTEHNVRRLSPSNTEHNIKRLSPSSTTEHNVKRLSPSSTTEHSIKRLSPSNTIEHNVKRLSPYSTSENGSGKRLQSIDRISSSQILPTRKHIVRWNTVQPQKVPPPLKELTSSDLAHPRNGKTTVFRSLSARDRITGGFSSPSPSTTSSSEDSPQFSTPEEPILESPSPETIQNELAEVELEPLPPLLLPRFRQGTVLYPFEPENDGELAVEAFDLVNVLEIKGEWVECITEDQRHGWVPFNYVQIDEEL